MPFRATPPGRAGAPNADVTRPDTGHSSAPRNDAIGMATASALRPAIEVRDERLSGCDGSLRGSACALSLLRRLLQLSRLLIERIALLLKLRQRAAMLGNPLLVD